MSKVKLSSKKALLVMSIIFLSINVDFAMAQSPSKGFITYLPYIANKAYHGFNTDQKFIGIYMDQYWTDGTVVNMQIADNLAGKKHSLTGWFINLQNIAFTSYQNDNKTNNFYRQLEALWNKGYISFVNIGSAIRNTSYDVTDNCPIPFSAYQVARGECDRAIQKMADLYHQWLSLGNGRRAFLAPLQEMNGVMSNGKPWTSYGGDPVNFKLAYQRIQDIFSQKGVTRNQIWWVFAPNGWSKAGNEFEYYYPGDAVTDIVALSTYNYGYCKAALPWPKWENYDTLYAPYLNRINVMAPYKPIIIAQTGTTAQYQSSSDFNIDAKNTWLRVNYQYLSNQPQVLGILYFDIDKSPDGECNWLITVGTTFQSGYQTATGYSPFGYLNWQTLQSIIP
jgi:hypothetical protein